MERTAQPPLLVAYRKAARMSQAELANRTGLSRGAISRIENGVHRPRLSTRCLLARALSRAPEELFGEDEA